MTAGRLLALVGLLAFSGCAPNGASAGVAVVPDSVRPAVAGDAGELDPPAATTTLVAPSTTTPVGEVADAARPGATVPLPLPIPRPSTVAVVGDSLTLSAEDEIEASLAGAGLEVLALDGVENRRMARGSSALPSGVRAIEAILDVGLEPELWIIALGTNDVGSGVDEHTFRDDVADVLTAVPPGVPVIWIDLWIRDRADAVAEANEALRSVSAIRPSTLVVDWYRYGEVPGAIVRDGVHLTDGGQQLFAITMAEAVEAMFGR